MAYRLLYNGKINFLLRNLQFPFSFFLNLSSKIPPSGKIKLKTDSGNIQIATNQTSYLTKVLFWEGYKNFEYSQIFEKLSKKINVFFDIGANIGYYSLLAAKANPSITVFAFEPAHGPKHYLKQNIGINKLENNIIFIDKALSKDSKEINFYEVESLKYKYLKYNLSGEHNTGTKTKTRNFIKTKVQSINLSNFIENNKIIGIDLIKIDTEGTEVEILESGKKFIEKLRPIIICETLFKTTENSLNNFFSNMDYAFYNHTKNGLIKVLNLSRDVDNGIRNCFIVPLEKEHLIAEFVIEK